MICVRASLIVLDFVAREMVELIRDSRTPPASVDQNDEDERLSKTNPADISPKASGKVLFRLPRTVILAPLALIFLAVCKLVHELAVVLDRVLALFGDKPTHSSMETSECSI
jgi:hypothetical protein